ncbi:MAG TPA: lysylphosphatidylglycerol synthase domain-containing protein [Caulobacteraceae bacterium]|jgi:putative membrane protein
MKIGVILTAIVGLALATAVIGYFGFGAVLKALEAIGWHSFAVLCAYSLLPILILGSAWFVLADQPPARFGVFVWARMVRDAAAEHLPFSQFGGFVIGARAAILHGVTATQAFSTTVVDATAELIAQIVFIGLGVGVLAFRLGARSTHDRLLWIGLISVGLCAVGAGAFILLQRNSSGLIEKLAARFLPGSVAQASAVAQGMSALYDQPARIAAAVALHFAAWTASATGAWIALRLTGVELGLVDVLAIESLLGAVRSAAFAAPMAIGVQEAGYALVGPLFGLNADMALALSLLKRARDLAIGLPALLVWQGFEAKRLIGGALDGAGGAP